MCTTALVDTCRSNGLWSATGGQHLETRGVGSVSLLFTQSSSFPLLFHPQVVSFIHLSHLFLFCLENHTARAPRRSLSRKTCPFLFSTGGLSCKNNNKKISDWPPCQRLINVADDVASGDVDEIFLGEKKRFWEKEKKKRAEVDHPATR